MEKIKELNMTELEQINGGWSLCMGIGASSEPMAQVCWGEGKNTEGPLEGNGITACAYVGLGFGGSEKYDDSPDFEVPYWMDNA